MTLVQNVALAVFHKRAILGQALGNLGIRGFIVFGPKWLFEKKPLLSAFPLIELQEQGSAEQGRSKKNHFIKWDS